MNIINAVGLYRSGSWYKRNQANIKKLVVHHSAWKIDRRLSNETILTTIQGWHEDKGWPGLSYHFVICPDGQVYQCNDFEDITWHDTINDDSVGVLVHGYFHPPEDDDPTHEQLTSLKDLLDWLCTENPQFPAGHDDVVGHRDRYASACPGDNLYKYVREYKENLGSVSWTSDECEEELKAMTENKEEWKEKAREREKKIKELGDVLEAAKGIAEELEDKLSIEQVKYIRMRDKLFKMQGELEKAAQDLEKYLTEIKKLKEKEYTLLESLVFLFKALRGVYNKWLMEQQSKS